MYLHLKVKSCQLLCWPCLKGMFLIRNDLKLGSGAGQNHSGSTTMLVYTSTSIDYWAAWQWTRSSASASSLPSAQSSSLSLTSCPRQRGSLQGTDTANVGKRAKFLLGCCVTHLGCGVAQEGCGVAQIVVRRPAVWQARVRFSSRHPFRAHSSERYGSGEGIGMGLDVWDLC